jgi:prepilin-type processing-associated H-X9-DG protein
MFQWPWNPSSPRDIPPNSEPENLQLEFFMRVTDLYPEYMPDPFITVCPSDADNDLRDVEESSCVTYTNRWPCLGGRISSGCETTPGDNTPCGVMGDIQDSYAYLGWVFDKLERNQLLTEHVSNSAFGISTILALLGSTDDYSTVPAPTQTTQVFEYFMSAWISCFGTLATDVVLTQNCIYAAPDQDWGPINDPDNPGLFLGVGDSEDIFRLREGIERFLITDINNPGASARAQSEIFTIWDITSTVAADYNHVPGGSNVLYLDGHVTFIRYPGPNDSPLNRGFAQFAGEISKV